MLDGSTDLLLNSNLYLNLLKLTTKSIPAENDLVQDYSFNCVKILVFLPWGPRGPEYVLTMATTDGDRKHQPA